MLNSRLLLFFALFIAANISSQEAYFTHSNNDLIKTVLVYPNDYPLSHPVISMGSGEFITIMFDELSESEKNYKYTIIHCNSDWHASDLLPSEYVQGFKTSFIDNYEYSFNTNIPYVNYRLQIPNDHTKLKVSGNYAVVITEEESNEALLVACFSVVDEQIIIKPEITFATEKTINKHHQQINFTLRHPSLTINDPNSEIKVFIQQNNRRDNIKSNLNPYHIEPGRIVYRQSADLVFEGGNEFRYFEATSTRYNTHGIESIQYHTPYYHFVLRPDEAQSSLNYNYRHDVNGNVFIRKQEADENYVNTEADYIFVHFTLPMTEPFFDGKIFLNGAFTNNQYSDYYQLKYNFDEKAYYTNILLKQGRYDYQYLFLPTKGTEAKYTPLENNFFETENDYRIYVYYRSFNDRYDRLLGYKLVTANKK